MYDYCNTPDPSTPEGVDLSSLRDLPNVDGMHSAGLRLWGRDTHATQLNQKFNLDTTIPNISFKYILPELTMFPNSTISPCLDPKRNRRGRKVPRNPTTMSQHLTGGKETDSFRISSRILEALHLAHRVQVHSRQRRLFRVPPGVTIYGLKLTISFLMNLNST